MESWEGHCHDLISPLISFRAGRASLDAPTSQAGPPGHTGAPLQSSLGSMLLPPFYPCLPACSFSFLVASAFSLSSCDLSNASSSKCFNRLGPFDSLKEVVSSMWHCPRQGRPALQTTPWPWLRHSPGASWLWPTWQIRGVMGETWGRGTALQSIHLLRIFTFRADPRQLLWHLVILVTTAGVSHTPGSLPGCHPPHLSPAWPQFPSIPSKSYGPKSLWSPPTLSWIAPTEASTLVQLPPSPTPGRQPPSLTPKPRSYLTFPLPLNLFSTQQPERSVQNACLIMSKLATGFHWFSWHKYQNL